MVNKYQDGSQEFSSIFDKFVNKEMYWIYVVSFWFKRHYSVDHNQITA